jgi:hypothetical protein
MSETQPEKSNDRQKGYSWRRFFAPDGETIWDAVWHLIWAAVVIRFLFFN